MTTDFARPRSELVAPYREVAPATLGHMHGVGSMDSGIGPLFEDFTLVGSGFTVRMRGTDRSALEAIEEQAGRGGVVVVTAVAITSTRSSRRTGHRRRSVRASPAGAWTARRRTCARP